MRCMMFPPIDAMLRSCPDAANNSASAMTGKRGANVRMRGHVAHAGERADPQIAVRKRLDPSHVGKMVDVQQTLGKSRAVLDQPEEVGAAGDEGELGILGMGGDRFGGIIGPGESEATCMTQRLPAASATASTMLG